MLLNGIVKSVEISCIEKCKTKCRYPFSGNSIIPAPCYFAGHQTDFGIGANVQGDGDAALLPRLGGQEHGNMVGIVTLRDMVLRYAAPTPAGS